MKRSPWLPLDANFQDDDDIVELTAHAELLFIRSIAHAKRLDNGGVITKGHLRRLCDKFDPAESSWLVGELIEAGLWAQTDDGRFTIPSFAGWNVSVEEIREARSENGRRGNHKRHGHDGAFEDCPTCNPPDDPVSPGPSPDLAGRPQGDSQGDRKRSRKPSQTKLDETRLDETTPPPPAPSNSEPSEADPDVVAVSDELLVRIGYFDESAGPDLIGYVERALGRGWPITDLHDAAADVNAMPPDEIETTPKRVLLGVIRKRANSDPPANSTNGSQPGSWDESMADRVARAEARVAAEETAQA